MSQEMKNKQTFGDYSGCSFFILGILTNTSDSSRLGTHSLSAPCFYKAKKKKKKTRQKSALICHDIKIQIRASG